MLNHYFVWQVPDSFSVEAALSVNQEVVCKIMDEAACIPYPGNETGVCESIWTSYVRNKAIHAKKYLS